MRDQGYISPATYSKVSSAGLGLHRGYHYEVRTQQYFFDFVQQELIDKYGVATAREGGLKVYTTLDQRLQAVAEQAIAAHPVSGAAAALVSTDVDTGEIKAMASSSSYDVSQFNLAATGRRQPGSSFKPYLLTAAVAQGVDPDSTYYPAPGSITLYPYGSYGEAWSVSGGAGGSISLRDATANSVNTVYAQLVTDIGWDTMDDMAKKMGVSSPLSVVPADVLGASDVTVLDQSNGFATIANGGVHHDPTAIAKVVFPDGHVDEPPKEPGNRVVSDGVAYTVADVMTGTLDYGTASCCDIPCPAAGKTGTTEEQADAWFVGYTPHVSTAVWVGNPDSRTAAARLRRRPRGADLAGLHGGGRGAALRRLPRTGEPRLALELLQRAHRVLGLELRRHDTTDTYGTTPDTTTTPDATTDDTDGYDPDLYAPGAGQDPAPTPDTGGGAGGGVTPN